MTVPHPSLTFGCLCSAVRPCAALTAKIVFSRVNLNGGKTADVRRIVKVIGI
jgi:hypothetical protein